MNLQSCWRDDSSKNVAQSCAQLLAGVTCYIKLRTDMFALASSFSTCDFVRVLLLNLTLKDHIVMANIMLYKVKQGAVCNGHIYQPTSRRVPLPPQFCLSYSIASLSPPTNDYVSI